MHTSSVATSLHYDIAQPTSHKVHIDSSIVHHWEPDDCSNNGHSPLQIQANKLTPLFRHSKNLEVTHNPYLPESLSITVPLTRTILSIRTSSGLFIVGSMSSVVYLSGSGFSSHPPSLVASPHHPESYKGDGDLISTLFKQKKLHYVLHLSFVPSTTLAVIPNLGFSLD